MKNLRSISKTRRKLFCMWELDMIMAKEIGD
jgi:hypothetical protein